MIGVKGLVDCVNASTSTTTDPLGILQLASVAKDFDTTGFVVSVTSSTNLPLAADNIGRVIYVEDQCEYRFSDGVSWTNDFTSTVTPVSALWAWGCNSAGQLGDGTTVNNSSPVSVVGGITNWCRVSVGAHHTLGIRSNGTAWAWGCNGTGRLGDNCTTNRSSPVSVVGGFTDWCAIAAGCGHSLAVRTNGTAWAWGFGTGGVLGDNTVVAKSSPVAVVGGFTNWCDVAAGGRPLQSSGHSVGIRTNGSVWTWGCNNSGQLGDNTGLYRSSPVSLVGGFSWCKISAGGQMTFAIRNNGTLWGWGCGFNGILGDNTAVTKSSPVAVVGGFTNWCAIATGRNHTHAIRTDGTLWAWGVSSGGALGNNGITSRSSPISVIGGFTDWCQVSAGQYRATAVRTNGTAWAWGCNTSAGRLGDGTTVDKSSPVSVVGGFTNWTYVDTNDSHSVGIVLYSTRGF